MFWFFGREARGILAPWPGIEPTPPTLEGKVLTTGLPGRFQEGQLLILMWLPEFTGCHTHRWPESWETCVLVPALPLTSHVTLEELSCLPGPQFLLVLNEGAGVRCSGGPSCLNCSSQGSMCRSGCGHRAVMCGSFVVSSLWSGGISGQGKCDLGEMLELETYFYN